MPKTLIFTRGKPCIENIRYISIYLRLRQGIYAPIKKLRFATNFQCFNFKLSIFLELFRLCWVSDFLHRNANLAE